ncbi:hypothetical protein LGM71_10715 [Burkholderia sp. AU33545]|uniref:hypothetical protein n=1 Tax=Burkholderia TaxID=32008 RepID=UPI001581BC42|nr:MULTISPECIES: hypothetical protein [Burkholderia]MCA8201525.1 hypothetical protein [Burkholderia sp. AU33545]
MNRVYDWALRIFISSIAGNRVRWRSFDRGRSGGLPDLSGAVRPARYTRANHAAVGRRTATAVAAPVRLDDSR